MTTSFTKFMNRVIVFLTLAITLSNQANSQDIHFAQVHATPTIINPSMTGLFNGQLRFSGNYRSQWNSFTNGYATAAASADMKLIGLNRGSALGGGLILTSDQAGDLGLSNNSATASVSILKALDDVGRNFLAFGVSNSFTNQWFDASKIKAFDREPTFFDQSLKYWDISAGMTLFSGFGKDNSFYLGASVYHINEPNVSFYKKSGLFDPVFMDKKFIVHGSADIRLTDVSRIKPSFIFMDQGPHKEINFGTFIKYKKDRGLSENKPFAFYVGGWVRWYAEFDVAGIDSWITAVRLDYQSLSFTVSFDTNISSLSRASLGQGGHEISVVKIFDWEKKRVKDPKLKCPALAFE